LETFEVDRYRRRACRADGSAYLDIRGGKRTWLGKNIVMLEIHKLVPALVVRYEIRLAEPEREWRIRNSWIVR
jgi:cytochrome P450